MTKTMFCGISTQEQHTHITMTMLTNKPISPAPSSYNKIKRRTTKRGKQMNLEMSSPSPFHLTQQISYLTMNIA